MPVRPARTQNPGVLEGGGDTVLEGRETGRRADGPLARGTIAARVYRAIKKQSRALPGKCRRTLPRGLGPAIVSRRVIALFSTRTPPPPRRERRRRGPASARLRCYYYGNKKSSPGRGQAKRKEKTKIVGNHPRRKLSVDTVIMSLGASMCTH